MATAKYGVKSPQWWKHLRRYCKRQFWKRHRKDGKENERTRF